jgi:hypothetical protein
MGGGGDTCWAMLSPTKHTGARASSCLGGQRALAAHMSLCPAQVWAALDKVPGHEEWKVRNLMALALCQAEAGAAAGGWVSIPG